MAEVLEALVSRHADLRAHLFDEAGKLRSFVNVHKNDEDIRHLDRESTAVATGDALSIVPSIAGGSPRRPPVWTPRRSAARSSSATPVT